MVAAAAAACSLTYWAAITTTGGAQAGGATTSALRYASAFSLPSVLPGGAAVTLAASTGRPVVLSFFASWCDSCQQELQTMSSVVRSAAGRVAVIGVDVNDSDSAAATLLAANHLTYPVGADHGGGLAATYGLVGLPTTVVLDAGHHVIGRVIGPLTSATAASWLSRLNTSRRS